MSLENLIKNFSNEKWDLFYINWELSLIKELGFDTNLQQFRKENLKVNDIINLDIDGIKYQVPTFLLTKNNEGVVNNSIKKALIFTRTVMLNKFFLPNNLSFPKSRILLENYFN